MTNTFPQIPLTDTAKFVLVPGAVHGRRRHRGGDLRRFALGRIGVRCQTRLRDPGQPGVPRTGLLQRLRLPLLLTADGLLIVTVRNYILSRFNFCSKFLLTRGHLVEFLIHELSMAYTTYRHLTHFTDQASRRARERGPWWPRLCLFSLCCGSCSLPALCLQKLHW